MSFRFLNGIVDDRLEQPKSKEEVEVLVREFAPIFYDGYPPHIIDIQITYTTKLVCQHLGIE